MESVCKFSAGSRMQMYMYSIYFTRQSNLLLHFVMIIITSNVSSMNLNVFLVMQDMSVTHVATYKSAEKGTLESHLRFNTNITIYNTIAKYLKYASSSNFMSSQNVAANWLPCKRIAIHSHAQASTERANLFYPRQGVCLGRLL